MLLIRPGLGWIKIKLDNSSEVEEGEECRLCGFPLCADHRVSLLNKGRCQTNIVFPGNKSEIRGGGVKLFKKQLFQGKVTLF